jgi:hypothetical protein
MVILSESTEMHPCAGPEPAIVGRDRTISRLTSLPGPATPEQAWAQFVESVGKNEADRLVSLASRWFDHALPVPAIWCTGPVSAPLVTCMPWRQCIDYPWVCVHCKQWVTSEVGEYDEDEEEDWDDEPTRTWCPNDCVWHPCAREVIHV